MTELAVMYRECMQLQFPNSKVTGDLTVTSDPRPKDPLEQYVCR